MANNVEWAHVGPDTEPWFLGPYDEAGDHQTVADVEEEDATAQGVAVGDVVIFGEPADLRKFFIRAAAEMEIILSNREIEQAKGESGE